MPDYSLWNNWLKDQNLTPDQGNNPETWAAYLRDVPAGVGQFQADLASNPWQAAVWSDYMAQYSVPPPATPIPAPTYNWEGSGFTPPPLSWPEFSLLTPEQQVAAIQAGQATLAFTQLAENRAQYDQDFAENIRRYGQEWASKQVQDEWARANVDTVTAANIANQQGQLALGYTEQERLKQQEAGRLGLDTQTQAANAAYQTGQLALGQTEQDRLWRQFGQQLGLDTASLEQLKAYQTGQLGIGQGQLAINQAEQDRLWNQFGQQLGLDTQSVQNLKEYQQGQLGLGEREQARLETQFGRSQTETERSNLWTQGFSERQMAQQAETAQQTAALGAWGRRYKPNVRYQG